MVAGTGSESGGSAGSSASGGSADPGGSQSVGVAAAPAGAGTDGGGGTSPMPQYPLITGDASCPPAATVGRACTVDGEFCVYAGFPAPVGAADSPMACTCESGSFSCVSSDEKGESVCPLKQPAMTLPGPCPSSAEPLCWYASPDNTLALAGCWCREQGGAGGDGGVVSNWSCGL
jgi:hypothetical protein